MKASVKPPAGLRRRALLATGLSSLLGAAPVAALPKKPLLFPRDRGAHPVFRTEWWYVTGQARAGAREFGFQVTFFRSRVEATQGMASRLAAKQLIVAHAAVTDLQGRKLLYDQQAAREGMDIARAGLMETDLKLRQWSLQRDGAVYRVRLSAQDFAFDLQLLPTQATLLQGDAGLSRKGPLPEQASYYYSEPQLGVLGKLGLRGETLEVGGKAWLDHEWSNEMLHPQARGWDWIGMNLDDGSALCAFQIRDLLGKPLWDGGSYRHPQSALYNFSPGEVLFKAQRHWTSPGSRAAYPVEWIVRTPADFYTVRALLENQELDSRASTGTVYWEGLSELLDSNGKRVGRGYLEMTGYASPIRLHG
jgi:predicted secreted hydrolase